jgi:hypothetical protein
MCSTAQAPQRLHHTVDDSKLRVKFNFHVRCGTFDHLEVGSVPYNHQNNSCGPQFFATPSIWCNQCSSTKFNDNKQNICKRSSSRVDVKVKTHLENVELGEKYGTR